MFAALIRSKMRTRLLQLIANQSYSNSSSQIASQLTPKTGQSGKSNQLLKYLKTLSKSPDWAKAVHLINREGLYCSRDLLPVFNNLATNAFREMDTESGWQILNKIVANDFQPHCETFQSYWDHCFGERHKLQENIEQMLQFIGKNAILLSKASVEELCTALKQENIHSVITNVTNEGICESCQHQMQSMQQSLIDFYRLKKEFEDVLQPRIGTELGFFRQLVNKKKIYDYVIDSLNVTRVFADSTGNILKQGKVLAEIVKQLRDQNKRVLVVGKKHIENWPEQEINYIRRNSTVYLSMNKEPIDDLLMMYAVFKSGPKTHFITNDFLIDYAIELSADGQKLFRAWQKQHQHFVSYDDRRNSVRIQRPKRFICHANKHTHNGHWHIPFTEGPLMKILKGPIQVPIQWACIKL